MLRGLFPEAADWIVTDVVVRRARRLGGGAFGEVFEATWKGSLVAAKKLHDIFFQTNVVPEEQCRQMIMEFVAECALQAMLRHPNIVPLFGVFLPPGGQDGEQAPVMISELMAETLRGRVLRAPRLTIRDIVDAALQIASALRFLHERPLPIAHRDLSANNVMLSFGGRCKIGDLGLAKVFTATQQLASTRKPGAEQYMPGEVLLQRARYNEKLDNFSLGVLILEMANGHEPRPSTEFTEQEEVSGRLLHALIPESRRRQADLGELDVGGQHVLKPLVERLFQPQSLRPVISEVSRDLEELRDSSEYSGSPSTLSSADAATERLARDFREVRLAMQQQQQQQAASDRRIEQLATMVGQRQEGIEESFRRVVDVMARMPTTDEQAQTDQLRQRIQQGFEHLQQEQRQTILGLTESQQRLQDQLARSQAQHQQHQAENEGSLRCLEDSFRESLERTVTESRHYFQDQLTRSHTQTGATLTRQQQAIDTVEQHLDHLRRDVERSHNRLEQRMEAIAAELSSGIRAVADSLRLVMPRNVVSIMDERLSREEIELCSKQC